MSEPAGTDLSDIRLAGRAAGLLEAFNVAGVLAAADVHVAVRLGELAGERDPGVLLAIGLAVRGPRLGHVFVDLANIYLTAAVDADEPEDLRALAWPEPDGWIAAVAASGVVAVGDDAEAESRPLRLVGSWLYLDRYWREERQVAADLLAFGGRRADDVRDDVLDAGLGRLFGGERDGRQCLAAATAVRRRLVVVAGGPGTGKTTTVARIVALLLEQAAARGDRPPLIALAAPTGKAAARLEEAVHGEAAGLDVDAGIRQGLLDLKAGTLHRLLGWRPDSRSRFRHDRRQRLPHDVVIVDETSMVSLSLMARLIEAVRSEARLMLVGDPGQLASIEAGAVLGDIVGGDRPSGGFAAGGIVVLDRVHRFDGGIARLAEAIGRGDGDGAIAVLAAQPAGVTWIAADVADPAAEAALGEVRSLAVAAGRDVARAAAAGSAVEALAGLSAFRVLCAHRRGPHGVATWTDRIEGWLEAGAGRWYVGRPVLVTENDYELGLYNGDTGVVVAAGDDRLSVAFERRGEILSFSPTRLGAVETVYAMTIHKSQGSQFDTAAVLLPERTSGILTRELLYTAATRARRRLIIAGTEEAIRAAVARPVARASGLRRRLWGEDSRAAP